MRVVIYKRILMACEGSYLLNRETDTKTPVTDSTDHLESSMKKREPKQRKLHILKSTNPQQELMSGISRNESSHASVSLPEKHASKL